MYRFQSTWTNHTYTYTVSATDFDKFYTKTSAHLLYCCCTNTVHLFTELHLSAEIVIHVVG